MPFFIIFLMIPLIEIWLFLTVADETGLGVAIGLCLLTSLFGFFIMQEQGFRSLGRARSELSAAGDPLPEILDGLCYTIAGALLLMPGFMTDFIGILLLFPPLRRRIRGRVGQGFAQHQSTKTRFYSNNYRPSSAPDDIIDGSFERVPDPALAADDPDHDAQTPPAGDKN